MRFVLAITAILFASLAFAEPGSFGFAGKWAGAWKHGPTAEETDRLVFSLTTEANNHVSGNVRVDDAFDVPVDWGFVGKDTIVFQIRFPSEHGPIPLVFLGHGNGAAIDFSVSTHDLPSLSTIPAEGVAQMSAVGSFEATAQR